MTAPTKLSELPDGWIVALDTETSALYVDPGAMDGVPPARVSAVSWSYRDPADPSGIVKAAAAFDQGQDPLMLEDGRVKNAPDVSDTLDDPRYRLPLGGKALPLNHQRRVSKWVTEHGPEILRAPNLQPQDWGRLMQHLRRMRLVLHNAKFDLLVIAAGLRGCEGLPVERGGGIDLEPSAVFDTQIAQHVIDPRPGTSLKPTSVRLHIGRELGLDEGTEDAEQLALKPWRGPQNDPRFDLIPWKVLRPYAELDAALTLLLYEYQVEWLNDEINRQLGFGRHVRRETDLMRVLYRMERRGIGYDAQASRVESEKCQKMASEVAGRLPFKATYPGAKKYFFGAETDEQGNPTGNLGHLPYSDKITAPSKTHPNGQPQVDEEVIKRLVAEDTPHAKDFQRWAELTSADGKWYKAWADMTGPDGRLRTCHRQTKVVSGRLSVERAQLHAIPHGYLIPQGLRGPRELFQAKPGYGLWEMDVSQAEIRIATAMARCKQMLDQFLDGRDSHSAACWLMFRDEFRRPDGSPMETLDEAEKHPNWDEFRQVAKRMNLGILYGAGVTTVRSEIKKFTGIDYPHHQVREWIDGWRAAFPPFVRFLEQSAQLAMDKGWVRLINGRIRYFSDYEPTHKAANQRIQGSQAEAIKECMIKVEAEFPGCLLLMIHDSLVAEFPLETGDEQAARVAQIMKETFEQTFAKPWVRGGEPVLVPFKADVKRWAS